MQIKSEQNKTTYDINCSINSKKYPNKLILENLFSDNIFKCGMSKIGFAQDFQK